MDSRASKPQRILIGIYSYYSIASGMNSYRYNSKSETFFQPPIARYIAVLSNALTLLLLPWYILEAFKLTLVGSMNRLMMHANNIGVIVRVLTIALTVLYRYRREKSINVITGAMMRIEVDFCRQQPRNAHIERHFSMLFYAKYFFMLYTLVISVSHGVSVAQLSTARWYAWAVTFMTFQLVSVLEVAVFGYFKTMCYIYRTSYYINRRLEELLCQLSAHTERRSEARLCAALQEVLSVHWQLSGMVRRVNHIYRFQMLALRFYWFTSAMLLGYFGSITILKHFVPFGQWFFFLLTCLIITLDVYLGDLIADITVRSSNETIHILKQFNEFTVWCNRLRNTCEEFALLLCSCKLRLDACGLFVVDMSLWFQMLASVISYTICLVQFHLVLVNEETKPKIE